MKAIIATLLGVLLLGVSQPACAAISVIDVGLIKTNLINAKRDLVEQILQGQRQVMQYEQLVAQVRQIDDYLERFGNPGDVDIAALKEALDFLEEIELGKTATDILEGLHAEEIFDTTGNYAQSPVSRDIRINGKTVASRNAEIYAPEVAARRTLQHHDAVTAKTLERRAQIKARINAALVELQSASTASEVEKLNVVIRSLESQLAANDSDLQAATGAALMQHYRNEVEARVQAKARVEYKRAELRVSTEAEIQWFALPIKPIPFIR